MFAPVAIEPLNLLILEERLKERQREDGWPPPGEPVGPPVVFSYKVETASEHEQVNSAEGVLAHVPRLRRTRVSGGLGAGRHHSSGRRRRRAGELRLLEAPGTTA